VLEEIEQDPQVTIKFLDPQGKPIPRAEVALYTANPRKQLARRYFTNGLAVIPTKAPEFWIEISEPQTMTGASLPYGWIRHGPVRVGGEVVLKLPRGEIIEGFLRGPDREPVPRVSVWAYHATFVALHDYVTTNRRGYFRLDRLVCPST
jgi:hypothetical protein